MHSEEFERKFAVGQMGESLIARWLRRRNNFVLPVYDSECEMKAPRLFTPDSSLIAPDMFVFSDGGKTCLWIEAKTKTGFTSLRRKNRHGRINAWQTGIDEYHFNHYSQIKEQSGWPVWLLFLQNGGRVKDSPSESPSGLYGEEISILKNRIDHSHPNPPPRFRPMLYWNDYDLRRLASVEELYG